MAAHTVVSVRMRVCLQWLPTRNTTISPQTGSLATKNKQGRGRSMQKCREQFLTDTRFVICTKRALFKKDPTTTSRNVPPSSRIPKRSTKTRARKRSKACGVPRQEYINYIFTLPQLAQVLQSSNTLKHHGICTRKWKNKSKEESSESQISLLHNPSMRHVKIHPRNGVADKHYERPGEGGGGRRPRGGHDSAEETKRSASILAR